MKPKLPRGIVLKYYLYQMTLSTGFSLPIWVIFLQSRGLSLGEIALLDGVYSAIILFGETPTGYIGDRIGRRNSLLVSIALLTVSMLAFGVASSFAGFVVVYAVWAIGATFRSGTASAWLYDALKERTDEDEYARISGRAKSFGLVVTAVTSLLAGFLADRNLFYPFLATGLVNAAGFFVVLWFPETSVNHTDDSDPFTVSDAISVVRNQLGDPSLRSFVVYSTAFFAFIATINLFVQPASKQVGIDVELLGLMYAGFTGVSALTSYLAGDIKDRIGIDRWFLVLPVLLGGLFVTVSVVPIAAIPLFFLLKAAKTATKPLRNQYVNDRVESVGRATLLSALSMTYSLVLIPLKIASGELAEFVGPVDTIAILGGSLLVVSLLVIAWERPVSVGRPTGAAYD